MLIDPLPMTSDGWTTEPLNIGEFMTEDENAIFLHKVRQLLELWQKDKMVTILLNDDDQTYIWEDGKLKKVE
jgi:hypothetical protein